MATLDELADRLHRIDRRGYGAYKSIKGAWRAGPLALHVDHVQADPFASPSRVRIHIDREAHGMPDELWATPVRRVALTDWLLRRFARAARRVPRAGGSGRSGRVEVDAGGAEVLARSGCAIGPEGLEVRFRVGLPARGRTVLGRAAAALLSEHLPEAASALYWSELDGSEARRFVELVEDHAQLQRELDRHGLVAFIRDGSVLPRASGVSSEPLEGAVPFESPPSLRVTLPSAHHGEVTGMGVPEGVTLITGGGFHGKTTLLEAIQLGVHPHVPGDGREWVVTRADAVKVRSEDGRAVAGMDLRPFIHDLPGAGDTSWFSTRDASGSTSLAAALLESVEAGSRCLLLDEDTCATNLLIRDARMRLLVQRETITPLVDRIRELYERLDVSTLLVLGGSGDYLDVADRVILLEEYLPRDATGRAREVAQTLPSRHEAGPHFHPMAVTPRAARASSFDPRRGDREKVKSRGLRELVFGDQILDLTPLEQLVDDSQARAIGVLLKHLGRVAQPHMPLREAVEAVYAEAVASGLFSLEPSPELALPRPLELAAAANRLRSLVVTPVQEGRDTD